VVQARPTLLKFPVNLQYFNDNPEDNEPQHKEAEPEWKQEMEKLKAELLGVFQQKPQEETKQTPEVKVLETDDQGTAKIPVPEKPKKPEKEPEQPKPSRTKRWLEFLR